MRTVSLVAFVLSVALGSPSWGADTPIEGSKLVIRVRGTTKKVVFVSKDAATPFPPPGGADDPTSGTPGGATVDVVTPDAIATLAVPGGFGWDGSSDTYRYKNPLAPGDPSPVRSMSLRQGRVLKITAKDVALPLTSPLGSVGIRITMGSTRSCALFDAAAIVSDQAGRFVGRNAPAAALPDCSDYALGLAAVCGNGLLEPGETCDGAATGSCPTGCDPDCTCAAYCGDGALDAGEECDGTIFGMSVENQACTYAEGIASPACQDDCRCCALAACSAFGFEAVCCPGYNCPQRIGPNAISYCRPTCSQDEDCSAGDICFLDGMCRTPVCSTNTDCGPGVCIIGVCCIDLGAGLVCP